MYGKLFLMTVFFLFNGIPLLYSQESDSADQPVTFDEILELVEAGVSDEVIISQIKATGAYFELTSEDILFLKDQGVSDAVIKAMIDTARKRPVRRRVRIYRRPYPSSLYYGRPYSAVGFGLGLGFFGQGGHHGFLVSPHFGHGLARHGFGGHGFSRRSFGRRH